MPMSRPPEEDIYYEFFKAKHTTQYLEDYVDGHVFAGQTLRERIQFGARVDKITKVDGKWVISVTGNTFYTVKLMVASGLTSEQAMPNLPSREKFKGPIIHQENFGRSGILSSADTKHITVLGGAKSAADMVYASVKAGKSVSWIVRKTGTGPGFFLSAKGKGPYKNAFELGSIRVASTLSPSFLTPETWWTRILHESNFGRKVLEAVWRGADKETLPKEGLKHREKLLPHTP